MTYECSGCGRKNFLTSHGLAKHAAKCKRNPPRIASGRQAYVGSGMRGTRAIFRGEVPVDRPVTAERRARAKAGLAKLAPWGGIHSKGEYAIWIDGSDEGTDPVPLDNTYMATSEQDAIDQAVKRGDLDMVEATNYAYAQRVTSRRRSRS